MKNIVLTLIAFCFFFFLPVFCPVSFAAVTDIPVIEKSDIVSNGNINFTTTYLTDPSKVSTGNLSRTSSSSYGNRFCAIIVQSPYGSTKYIALCRLSLAGTTVYLNWTNTTNSYGYDDFCFYEVGNYSTVINSINIPVFSSGVSVGSGASAQFSVSGYENTDWYKYLFYGDLSNTLNVNGYGVASVNLGYLNDVQYFVDSYAYHNDTANTPEWVKWGSTSTTGIDLSDSRYQVEFMMEDKSTFLRNGANDSWLTQAGVPFASAVAFAESKLEYAASYLFPSGSDQRALLQGKAAKTSLYGKASGLGSVPASAGVYKFSVASQYISALENDSSSDKGLFFNVISDILSNQGTVAEKFFNNYQSSGKALNFTYDLYARIVDSTSGTSGNWLKIDRHNSPFEWSNNDRFLNGGVTASKGHRFINFNPETNIFQTLPDDDPVDDDDNPLPDGDPALPVPVGTGYVDNNDNSIQNIYNNYNYTYNTFYDNDLFYTDLDGKNKDTGSGMIETIGILGLLGILWTWYLALFGDLLPLWAVVLVPVFGTLFVAFLVWKFGKGLLP